MCYITRNEAYFALLELDHPVPVVPKGLVIGSKLDTDIHSNTCRIAFSGTSHFVFDNERYFLTVLPRLKVFKMKLKVRCCWNVDEFSVEIWFSVAILVC